MRPTPFQCHQPFSSQMASTLCSCRSSAEGRRFHRRARLPALRLSAPMAHAVPLVQDKAELIKHSTTPATPLRDDASLVTFIALVGCAAATTGLDAIQPMSSSTFTCLKSNGYSFFIARAWESTGAFDETGIQNIKNAKAAGWEYVDAYIFPCLKSSCAAPAAQVEATVNRLKSEGASYGMIWLDIEIYNWSSDQNNNRNIINAMGNQLNAMGVNWGIYTNNNNWGNIVGISWSQWASRPLWWANYNGHQDYSGFVPFGGWTKPAIHQYAGDYKAPCSVDLDLNWY